MNKFTNRKAKQTQTPTHLYFLPSCFLIFRLIFFASLTYEIIPGYGDYWNFFRQAGLGFPFLNYWTEFPPVFPIISRVVYSLVGGREHAYGYLLAIFFSLVQAGCIWLLLNIIRIVWPNEDPERRGLLYFLFTAGLFYSWGYFDTLAVFFMLLGIYLILLKKDIWAILAIALGILTKWFPVLFLPAIWKIRKPKKALSISIGTLVVVAAAWFALFTANADFTKASIMSQLNKGSWETVWALIDGNLTTGNFNPEITRTIASSASISTGNPAVIPTWLSLLVIGGIGFFVFWKSSFDSALKFVGFGGFTLVMFFLWSPGYSPQWVLYLLPLVILCFENNRSRLLSIVLVLVNLLEWPILLSRGWFQFLEEIILLRTAIFILLALLFAQIALVQNNNDDDEIIISNKEV